VTRPILTIGQPMAAATDAAPRRRLAGANIAVDARYVQRRGMGIRKYLADAISVLTDEGASVTLLTNFPSGPYVGSFPGVEWACFGSRRNIVWEQLQLPLFLRRHAFDLYWAPASVGMPLLPVPRTWKLSTTHDVIPLRLPAMYLMRDPGFAIPYLVWTAAAMLRSDVLITDSHAAAADIRHYFRRHAVVVPPVFGGGARPSRGGNLPEGLAGRSYLVYNGGIDPRKNVGNLLAGFAIAARRDPSVHLALMGDGYEYYAPLIADLGISERIVMTGYVDEDTKNAILASGLALVYPSLYEGFGLPILEAFTAGLPVLSCRNSALEEVAGDAAVYVDPRDPESIAAGISEVCRGETATQLRAKGAERLARYAPERAREELLDVVEHGIVAARSRRSH